MSSLLERTERRPKVRAEKLKAFIRENRRLTCSCPGCSNMRDDASIYCAPHRRNYREHGHPIMEPPDPEVIRAIEQAVVTAFEELPEPQKASLEVTWASGVVKLKRSPAYAVPFHVLQGVSGYTQESKASVYLAHYQKHGHPVGNIMLRWIALRLYAELHFWPPPGKADRVRELTRWVNIQTGKYITLRAGFKKTVTTNIDQTRLAGSVVVPSGPEEAPVRQKTIYKVRGMGGIRRAIGAATRAAVEAAMGRTWHRSPDLQAAAQAAILRLSHGLASQPTRAPSGRTMTNPKSKEANNAK